MTSTLTCRKAEEKDMMIYLDWANDQEVRQNSFNSEPISLEVHQKWFQNAIKNESNLMLLFEINGDPIGQTRFQITKDSALLNYSIASAHRGKRLSSPMITLALQTLYRTFPLINQVDAKVKNENISSIKTLIGSGFQIVSTDTHETILQRQKTNS
jgi:UDP-2,4-diacetamido-2,4,6-trideoxy-beta-L-altropyranose hydrolase